MKDFDKGHVNNAYEVVRTIRNHGRKKLLHLINTEPGHTVTALYKKLKLNESWCSQQLAVLRRAKIIKVEKKGREVYYSVNEPFVAALQAKLKELNEL